ncbi:TonB-dependent receptor [Phenylobacterium sp.]|uniref:TonB-dependent receptor n=1 Tax=Phenylobacterium sp. TaxID=1871053 RepID=UPI0025E36B48|nr:TonB-dependent receptor [Phenylobacterium sp.]
MELEEMVVTAERREQSVNDVGMAISAFSGDTLEAARVTSVQDLTQVVPGFTASRSRSGLPIYTLRGIGFNVISASSTSPVGTYVDEAAYVYPAMNGGPIFDISRVEVLKGPQGTLYGRNTTGGLVDLITNKPVKDFEGGVTAEAGNYRTRNFEGFVNLPLSDAVSVRLAMRSEDSDQGWQKSFTRPDDRLGEIHKYGVRGMVSWEPSDDFDFLLSINHWRDTSDTTAQQYQTYITNPYTANPAVWRVAPHYAAFDRAWKAANVHSNKIADWEAGGAQGALTRYGTEGKGQFSNAMGALERDDEFTSTVLHSNWKINDQISLISLTGFNLHHSFAPYAGSGTPFEFAVFVDGGKTSNLFEELRLQGETGRLQWTVGGYYGRDKVKSQAPGLFDDIATVSNLRALFASAQNCAVQGGAPGSLPSGAGTGLPNGCVQGPGGTFNPKSYTAAQISEGFRNGASHGEATSDLFSLFAHAEFAFTEELSAVGGLRYSDQDQKGSSCAGTLDPDRGPVFSNQFYIWDTSFRYLYYVRNGFKQAPPGPIGSTGCLTYDSVSNSFGLVQQRLQEDNLSWQAGLNWKFAPRQLLYVTLSKGYLAGVLPSTSSNSAVQLTPVKQEELQAYEVGAKLSLFERRVQANVSGFYYDYTDKQVNAYFPDVIFTALPVLINVPKSKAYGVDGSVTWAVTENLTGTVSGVWLETEVTKLPACAATQLFGCGRDSKARPLDYKGFEFAYAPKYQASAIIMYDRSITDDLGFAATLSANYQSRSFALLGGDRLPDVGSNLTIKGYSLFNLSAGVYGPDHKWGATLWVKNLTDRVYATNVVQGQDYYARTMGMPRTYGLSLSYRFD